MPAITFFAMYNAAKTLDAREKIELCDIGAIPLYIPDHYKQLRAQYERILEEMPAIVHDEPNPAVTPTLDAKSEEARVIMFSLFAMKKRSGG